MIKIAIILGSTRPNRNGEAVAKWVCEVAKTRSDAEYELVPVARGIAVVHGDAEPLVLHHNAGN